MPDEKATQSQEYGRAINAFDLFELDTRSNALIAEYRKSLGLKTPNNRIDTGDLRQILLALYDMGFSVVEMKK